MMQEKFDSREPHRLFYKSHRSLLVRSQRGMRYSTYHSVSAFGSSTGTFTGMSMIAVGREYLLEQWKWFRGNGMPGLVVSKQLQMFAWRHSPTPDFVRENRHGAGAA